MVRVIEFGDGTRWVARLQLPRLSDSETFEDVLEFKATCEYNTMLLVLQESDIPTPKVHAFEARNHSDVGASFMLMDCLAGNVGMDLVMSVAQTHKSAFFIDMARVHVSTRLTSQLSTFVID